MSPLLRLRFAAADIKLAHSVFALPFAVLAAFLSRPGQGGEGWFTFARQLLFVVICMFFARTWAMLINRWADHRIDAINPRTTRRAIPAGRLTARQTLELALVAAGFFILAAADFWLADNNPWPVYLSIPVLLWIAFYSFTKRFTWLCHVFLGGALAASPLAAAIAIRPGALGDTPALFWLAGMVLLWVAGFDIIYALQDVDFDRANRVFSVPAAMGPGAAIWLSRILHLGAFAMLLMARSAEPRFGPIFTVAVGLVGVLLITEHAVLARRGKAGLDMAFFTINGVVSCVLGAAGVLDLLA